MQIGGFPIWVITGIERPAVHVEFIGEDENPVRSISV